MATPYSAYFPEEEDINIYAHARALTIYISLCLFIFPGTATAKRETCALVLLDVL